MSSVHVPEFADALELDEHDKEMADYYSQMDSSDLARQEQNLLGELDLLESANDIMLELERGIDREVEQEAELDFDRD